jgi:hypothetical protein
LKVARARIGESCFRDTQRMIDVAALQGAEEIAAPGADAQHSGVEISTLIPSGGGAD